MKTAPNEEFLWIHEGRAQLPTPGLEFNCRVKNLIPSQFESYAKLLHVLEPSFDILDDPLTSAENALLSIPECHSIKTFVMELRQDGRTRFSWKEIADRIGVPYLPEINHEWFRERLQQDAVCWPRFISGPTEGNLDEIERRELVKLLSSTTATKECFFRFAEYPTIGTDEPVLFQGMLNELEEFLSLRFRQFSPEYWWSADRSWCVCSDYDLEFTVVAGNSELIERLLRSRDLEAIEVTTETRVDSLVRIP